MPRRDFFNGLSGVCRQSISAILSRKNVFDDVAFHIGEPHVAAGIPAGQLLVVQAQQVQNGGVPVVDVDSTFDGFIAVFIGGSVGEAAFGAAAGQPPHRMHALQIHC